jgi:predicted nucleotidyltransferase
MEMQSITTRLPESSIAYIFGSFLSSASPSDIDVLVVYDTETCPPDLAYELHRDFINQLRSSVGLDVHITLLTKSEERGSDFINDSGAIRMDQVTIRRLLK